jgi:hypothetical protein
VKRDVFANVVFWEFAQSLVSHPFAQCDEHFFIGDLAVSDYLKREIQLFVAPFGYDVGFLQNDHSSKAV